MRSPSVSNLSSALPVPKHPASFNAVKIFSSVSSIDDVSLNFISNVTSSPSTEINDADITFLRYQKQYHLIKSYVRQTSIGGHTLPKDDENKPLPPGGKDKEIDFHGEKR